MQTLDGTKFSDLVPKTEEQIKAMCREMWEETNTINKCETPIEHDFAHCFLKIKAEGVSVAGQVWCETHLGKKRPDFVLNVAGRKIAIECDGKEFHDRDADQIRDEAILKARVVDIIYRIPGRNLRFHTYEVLDLLRIREPNLFCKHGILVLESILNDGAKREDSWGKTEVIRILRREEEDQDDDEVKYKKPDHVLLAWKQ